MASPLIKKIDWKKFFDLVPAIAQDARSGMVLMLGYMNQEALKKTLKSKKVWFFSRSKKRLWMKGEQSGNILSVVEINLDCDNDTLLIKVNPKGPTCHTGNKSCFKDEESFDFLEDLEEVIKKRKKEMPKDSYTATLFKAGLERICEKVAEESTEVIKAARKETRKRLSEESSDLIYHLLVLLVKKGVNWREVKAEMKSRRK